ncbi:hypothetical protein BaRGS_00001601 [Batillaria attramentaria]|uniref:Uncharacterized protein n=1 Tax=Batillaria attramentaria TaxID=370345 RepID=A0ABD0M8F0_9CAEN
MLPPKNKGYAISVVSYHGLRTEAGSPAGVSIQRWVRSVIAASSPAVESVWKKVKTKKLFAEKIGVGLGVFGMFRKKV